MKPRRRIFIEWAHVLHAVEVIDHEGDRCTFVYFAEGQRTEFFPDYDTVCSLGEMCTPTTPAASNSAMVSPCASSSTSTLAAVRSTPKGLRSSFSAFTRTLAPVFRKISKVFMRGQRARVSPAGQSSGGVLLCLALAALVLTGCRSLVKPQAGGAGSVTFGGTSAPTVVTTAAPENSQTPTTTTVEKTTTREFIVPSQEAGEALAPAQPANQATRLQNPTRHRTGAEAAGVADVVPRRASPPSLLRETVTERATTQLGSSWEDKARELGAKLSNMRGVMWAGVLLLIGGPIVGIKMGWPLNGAIAGATGLLLIVLAQVVPGNEAWFGLGGLFLILLVAYVYYRAHHDAAQPPPPSP